MNKKIKLSCDEIILVNPVSNTVSNNMTNNTITSTNNIVTSTVVTITTNTDQIKVQEKEQKEEYDLTEKQIETILDDISNYSFWSWVMKYRILGINNLYKILGLEMDLKVKDELELLPALKIKFDDYKRRDR